MKKKFLSLMMAAAMIATTSVSAFAADDTQNITVAPKGDSEVTIPMQGDITDNQGAVVPSSINVTVPTAANFTVNKEGVLQASDITVTSHGEKVEVVTGTFTDSTGEDGIQVVEPNQFANGTTTVDRKKVSLQLRGTHKTVYFKTEASGSGIYGLDNSPISADSNTVLGYAVKGTPLTLEMTGKAGRGGAEEKAITDKFTLTLKIRKAR